MKRMVTAAALAAALGLGGCQTAVQLFGSSNVQLKATQAEYVAEAAFSGASTALQGAHDSGLLKGPAAAKAKQLYEAAHAALLLARQARAAQDWAGVLSHSQDATSAAGQLQATAAPSS